jgi:hypothetical protein
MKRFFLTALLVMVVPVRSFAGIAASAVISLTSSGTENQYSATLKNTGTTTIGTFWYAWVPGKDFLLTSPINIGSPANWDSFVTNNGGGDGYAIQWTADTSADDLAAGSNLSGFSFQTTDTPSQLSGNSFYYPTEPVGTSFVYTDDIPLSGPSDQFVATVVAPEPASLGLLAAAATLMLRRCSRKIA